MTAERFTLDSNILVYATDSASALRHGLAVSLVDGSTEADCVLTVQSLGEFFHAVTRKGIAPRLAAARQVHDWMGVFSTAAASETALGAAIDISAAGLLSFWDALLVATAEEAGCSLVLSEDMHDGMKLGGITIRNPFAGSELARDICQLIGLEA
jgi:predicted nucleic acid-binding protein